MTDAAEQSRVLTLVFTDLADSTALKSERGDDAVEMLIGRHREHVTQLAGECAGRVIDWAGDGCFLTFEMSSAGVMFALRLQQVHADETDLPGVRIGIHLGEVTEKTGPEGAARVGGLAVDVAARVCGLAKPGQVLMSSSVYNSARQRMGVDALGRPILWQLHGLYDLKGVDHPLEIGEAGLEGVAPLEAPAQGEKARPVAGTRASREDAKARRRSLAPMAVGVALVLAVAVLAYVFGQRTGGGDAPGSGGDVGSIKSLAVLPLDNLSNDPEQDYFADGMTEAITAELAKIKALKVISRTSAMRYKDTELSMPEIAAELGVEGLIEGSVFRDGDDVRITAQLIHGPSDRHLWAGTYEGLMEDVLKLQGDVALAIADALHAELTGEERTRIAHFRSIDPSAQEAYLLGQHFLDELTEDGLNDAIRYFEEATSIEPQFPEAWAQLADAHISAVLWGYATGAEAFPTARAAARRALDIDPDLALAHRRLGYVSMTHDREWQEAEDRFKRALELRPSSAEAHASYGWFLRWVGRMDEAFQHIQTAIELDHEDPWIQRAFGEFLQLTGEPSRAESILQELLAQRPDFLPAIESLVETHVALGRYDQAIEGAEHWIEVTGGDSTSQYELAYTLALTGQVTRAKALADDFASQTDIVDNAFLGLIYAVLGEYDAAFEFLEKGYENRDWMMVMMRTEPYRELHFDNVSMTGFRKDSRYWELMDRMKFPPLPPEHTGYADEQAWLARKAAAEAADAPIEKIAVLPFDDMGADTGEEWFADGMTETLVAQLAKIDGVRVISRTSAMRYKDSDESIPAIARALGVDALIEGSVQRAGNDVRITAQLIHGVTDEHLWADSYDGQLDNILSLQSEVALSIAKEIKVAVAPEDALRLREQRKISRPAQEAHLKGRYHMSRRTGEDLERAIDYFKQAISLDDEYAAAHAGLARAYLLQSVWNFVAPLENLPLIESAAQRAIQLDDASSDPYVVMAATHLFNQDPLQAETQFLRAIELDPEYPTAHHLYSIPLTYLGRDDEAIREMALARELDPVSLIINTSVGTAYVYAREYDQALQGLQQTLEMDPNFRPALFQMPGVLALNGQYDEAIATSERLLAEHGRTVPNLGQHAMVLSMAGRSERARGAIDEANEIQAAYNPAFFWAVTYTHLGDFDEAVQMVEQIINEKEWDALGLRVNPFLDPLRSNPRFQALIDGMNLPPVPPDHPVAIMERERAEAAAN